MDDGRSEAPDGGLEDAVQLLTPAGVRVDHPAYAFVGDDALVRDFYADMVRVRRVDAEAIALQRQGELGLWPSLLGQEAAQIGAVHAMRRQDYAFPTYREHGITMGRGVDPLRLLAMFRGIDPGTWDIAGHGVHLYSIIIGTQGLQATGYGMGLERDGLVARTVHPEVPPRVEYALTPLGGTLRGIVHALKAWSAAHAAEVDAARARYDRTARTAGVRQTGG